MSSRPAFSFAKFGVCLVFVVAALAIVSQYEPTHFEVVLTAIAGGLVGAGVYRLARPLFSRGGPNSLDGTDA